MNIPNILDTATKPPRRETESERAARVQLEVDKTQLKQWNEHHLTLQMKSVIEDRVIELDGILNNHAAMGNEKIREYLTERATLNKVLFSFTVGKY